MIDFWKKNFHIIWLRIVYFRKIITIDIIENEKLSIVFELIESNQNIIDDFI